MTEQQLQTSKEFENLIAQKKKQLAVATAVTKIETLQMTLESLEDRLESSVTATDYINACTKSLENNTKDLIKRCANKRVDTSKNQAYVMAMDQQCYLLGVAVKNWNRSNGTMVLGIASKGSSYKEIQIKLDTTVKSRFAIEHIKAGDKRLDKIITSWSKIQNLKGTSNLAMLCHHLKMAVQQLTQ